MTVVGVGHLTPTTTTTAQDDGEPPAISQVASGWLVRQPQPSVLSIAVSSAPVVTRIASGANSANPAESNRFR